MQKILIRKVEEKDSGALAKMIRNVFEEFNAPKQGTVYSDPTTDDLFQLFKQKRSILWVAEVDNKACGCCGIYPTEGLPKDYAELSKFYLLSSIRGKGIGKQLMEKCFQFAKENYYKFLYLESLPHYSTAVSIYEKYGFVQLDHPLGNSGHTSCNIWMQKKID